MPVPITNDLFSKQTAEHNFNTVYRDMLKNKNLTQQNLTAQLYFKNYIQESLRFLREKAKEHEAKLRNQICNQSVASTTVTSLNSNNRNLKIVKIQTNKKNNLTLKQLTLNKTQNNKIAKSNEEIDMANKLLIVKPTVTNKCKLRDQSNKTLVKQINCTNKKPHVVKINRPQTDKPNLLKRGGQDIEKVQSEISSKENKDSQLSITTTNTPSSDMFYVKKLNRSVECLEDFNDFLRNNISYTNHYCGTQPQRNHSTRNRSKHQYPCSTNSRSTRYIDADWEAENDKHLRRYERDASDRYYLNSRYDHEHRRRAGTCTRKSRSKSKYRRESDETRSKVIIEDYYEKTEKKDAQSKKNRSHTFSPEIPTDTKSTDSKKRDKSMSILSKSSVYLDQQPSKSNTTIAVQTTPSDISINAINESPYVQELKAQLETLKAEITRLQNAQSNLEKTLKQQNTVIRPIIYTGYPEQNDYSAYSFDQFIQSDYKLQNEEAMKAAMNNPEQFMMMPEAADYYNQANQPYMYDAQSNANYDEALRTQLTQQMNAVNLNKSTQNKSTDSKANASQATTTTPAVAPSQNTHLLTTTDEPNKLKQTILNKIDTDLKLKKNQPTNASLSLLNVQQPAELKQQNVKYNAPLKESNNTLKKTQENGFVKYSQMDLAPINVTSSAVAQQSGPTSPNAQLYQKLLKLISSSSSYSEQINSQMNALLSNPNIKAQLKQLHSQLLKNPSQYLPQLENILLEKPASPTVTQQVSKQTSAKSQEQQSFENYKTQTAYMDEQSPQDLLDLRQYYAKDEAKRYATLNSIYTKNHNQIPQNLSNHRIAREFKH